ncbi:UDP-N-acetylmuramoyl-L-alanine--D-glutamate ligase [Parasphingopyxis marina]|uniref:UDP-N-acetylmuramoylalanine--D-glutamate ligase n=1 Tax=Parasphingopyxis marina TaxID=2761622 RepID=A0A842HX13_9SPHN|nr:UDP-N-acetylmuramoyl-L-alanine--D-glutamate ligase [Parasphingopyxis marina]MBC2776957.1 UDP-N-acetylmuramoyl-L-alanine--D-glutamate ligase [Parasphingopyxis marina]
MKAARAFAGKRYAVLGLARTGLSVVDYLWNSSATVIAWDDKEEARERVKGKAKLADPMEMDLEQFDAVVVSPGVPLNTHPISEKIRRTDTPLICDIELFSQARAELPPHKVIGITGTNGKSTTAALIHHICKTAGLPTRLGGNIGKPILGEMELEEGGVYVLELSSFQIDLTQSLDCDVAILLNITPDHLDRYDGFDAYAASKARLFAMQSPDHSAIIAIDDAPSAAIAVEAKGAVIQISAGGCMDQSRWPTLQGPHNAQNAIAAMSAARRLGISEDAIEQGLRSYPGLPHRMERIAEKDGVLFINDSKATNPTSTAPALAAYPAVHWILGGRAKTDDLDACAPFFDHVRAAYTIGETADMFEELLAPVMTVSNCGTMRKAVQVASRAARPGETVLLSPACASFDQYRDFEERGDDFRAAVGSVL